MQADTSRSIPQPSLWVLAHRLHLAVAHNGRRTRHERVSDPRGVPRARSLYSRLLFRTLWSLFWRPDLRIRRRGTALLRATCAATFILFLPTGRSFRPTERARRHVCAILLPV